MPHSYGPVLAWVGRLGPSSRDAANDPAANGKASASIVTMGRYWSMPVRPLAGRPGSRRRPDLLPRRCPSGGRPLLFVLAGPDVLVPLVEHVAEDGEDDQGGDGGDDLWLVQRAQ